MSPLNKHDRQRDSHAPEPAFDPRPELRNALRPAARRVGSLARGFVGRPARRQTAPPLARVPPRPR
jgi:hypothetical protein